MTKPSEPDPMDRYEPVTDEERAAVWAVRARLILTQRLQGSWEFSRSAGFYHPKNERFW